MAAEVASAFVTLLPSAKGFGPAVAKEIGSPVEKASGQSGKRAGSVFARGYLGPLKAVGGLALGLFAVDKVVGFFKAANAEARESQKVGALTTQVIKSTGGAANVTAKQVGSLATAISNKTGIDDEQIQSSENMLLTFKGVRNEVGKGNDIFNQATQTVTDMSSALGQSGKSSAIQLGKALNDPIKGITALSRVGVTFTDQQKKQIKAMVKSGDTLGAQKIILHELNSEFGGAAAASATSGEKLGTAFKNLEEQVGTAFLPVIDKVAGVLTTRIIPAVSSFITGLQDGTGAGGAVRRVFEGIVATLKPVAAFIIGTVVPAVGRLFASFSSGGGSSAVLSTFRSIVAFITTQVLPRVLSIAAAFRGLVAVLTPIVLQIVGVFRTYWPQISAVIAQVITTVKVVVTSGLTIIAGVFRVVTAIIRALWSVFGSGILATIGRVLGAMLGIVKGALNIIQGVFRLFAAIFTGNWKGAWAAIKQILSGAWQVIRSVISASFAIIRGIFSAALAGLKALFALGWDAMKSIVSTAWGKVKSAVSTGISNAIGLVKALPGKILGALVSLDTLLYDAGVRLIQGLINGITGMFGKVQDKLGELTGKLTSWKGPPKRDATILQGAGELVIGGFIRGMESQYSAARASLQGLTGSLSGAAAGRRPLLSVSGAGAAAAAAGGRSVNFYGPVGYDPDEIAQRIAIRDRNAASVYDLAGVR